MSSRLIDEQLDSLFGQMPLLAGRPRRLEELSGGLTNRNVKVTTPSGLVPVPKAVTVFVPVPVKLVVQVNAHVSPGSRMLLVFVSPDE